MMLCSSRMKAGLVLSLLAVAMPASAGFLKVENIVQCMQQNLVERGALRNVTARTKQTDGGLQELAMQLRWRPNKKGDVQLNLQVTQPQEMAGTTYLIKPSDQGLKTWLYVPALESVRKVNAQNMSQALWGTEFSYAQLRQILGLMVNGKSKRLADEKLAEREVYVVDTHTSKNASQHLAVRSYIDKQSCLLLRAEYLDRSGELLQILETDPANLIRTEIDSRDIWILLQYQLSNLQTGQKTVLDIGGINLMEDTSAAAFHEGSFYETVKVLH